MRPALRLLPLLLATHLHTTTQADTIQLLPVADTTLIEAAPTHNLGAQVFCNAGTSNLGSGTRNRALLRFDPTTVLPPGSHITQASLVLEVTGEPSGAATPSTFRLHRLLQPWGEGNKTTTTSPGLGLPATLNEATWTHRFAFTPQAWNTPGATPGTDFTPEPSAETPVYGVNDSPYTFGPHSPASSPRSLAQDVQLWLEQPDQNFGWILLSTDETLPKTARRFGSREDPPNAPRLEVTFAPPLRIHRVTLTNQNLEIAFHAEPQAAYRGESTPALIDQPAWTPFAEVSPSPEAREVTLRDPITPSPHFYRIVRTSP